MVTGTGHETYPIERHHLAAAWHGSNAPEVVEEVIWGYRQLDSSLPPVAAKLLDDDPAWLPNVQIPGHESHQSKPRGESSGAREQDQSNPSAAPYESQKQGDQKTSRSNQGAVTGPEDEIEKDDYLTHGQIVCLRNRDIEANPESGNDGKEEHRSVYLGFHVCSPTSKLRHVGDSCPMLGPFGGANEIETQSRSLPGVAWSVWLSRFPTSRLPDFATGTASDSHCINVAFGLFVVPLLLPGSPYFLRAAVDTREWLVNVVFRQLSVSVDVGKFACIGKNRVLASWRLSFRKMLHALCLASGDNG